MKHFLKYALGPYEVLQQFVEYQITDLQFARAILSRTVDTNQMPQNENHLRIFQALKRRKIPQMDREKLLQKNRKRR